MIYRLQRRFILISAISILLVISIVFAAILVFNIFSNNKNMDILADSVSEGGGKFPAFGSSSPKPGIMPNQPKFDFITPETPFSTRHFTVYFDQSGNLIRAHTDAIYSINETQAVEYARKAISAQRQRGWLSSYRYKVFDTDSGIGVVFIDGSANRAMMTQSITIAGVVLLIFASLILILIILFSKRAIKPIAESYEKQRQFITDANHELKTPLTLIMANLDIAEDELGKNEWLDDIRDEGHRMTELVNQLVALSRMDEDKYFLQTTVVPLGKIVADTVAEFEPLAHNRDKSITANVDTRIVLQGEESLLRQLIGILLDNAIKYCDPEGDIHIQLHQSRHTVLTIENTYAAVGDIELQRLFDRFYRADKARTFIGGYGIGLSMAKSIVEKHKGEITVYQKDHAHIGFKVTL